MSWRGFAVGALSLIALQMVVTRGAGRVAGLFAVPGELAARFLDPTVPAIPDRRESRRSEPFERRSPAAARTYPNPSIPAIAAAPNN